MRSAAKVAIVSAVVALLGFGSTATAHADGLLGPEVSLSASAPTPGEVISGIRMIEGVAKAPEGVTRVDLYVMSHSLTGSVDNHVPVASTTSTLPMAQAPFSFQWDSAKTVQGLVDVVVVATTPTTRTGEARVVSLQVRNVAKPPAAHRPAAQSQPQSAVAPHAAPRQVAVAPALVSRRAPQTAARVVARRVPPPVVARASADQATAFYAALGGLVVDTAAAERPVALPREGDTGRGHAPTIALAFVMLLAAAHAQRAVRVQLAPRD